MNLRVGIVDGGVGQLPAARLASSSLFVVDDAGVAGRGPDAGGAAAHGAMVAALILAAAPRVTLLDARVASATQRPTPRRVADAVHWCIDTGAGLINLSLGLAEDREPLRAACARALAAGIVLVAAAPARGAAVFPASYPGVLAVSGDARCADGDWSLLAASAFGACPQVCAGASVGGASVAAARFSGIVASYLLAEPQAGRDQLRAHLAAHAAWRGRERRMVPA